MAAAGVIEGGFPANTAAVTVANNPPLTRQVDGDKRLGRERVAFEDAHVEDGIPSTSSKNLIICCCCCCCRPAAPGRIGFFRLPPQSPRKAREHAHARLGAFPAGTHPVVAILERRDGTVFQRGALVREHGGCGQRVRQGQRGEGAAGSWRGGQVAWQRAGDDGAEGGEGVGREGLRGEPQRGRRRDEGWGGHLFSSNSS